MIFIRHGGLSTRGQALLRRFLYASGTLVVLLVPRFGGPFWTSMIAFVFIMGLFALSHDLLIGHTGLVSLGHTAFFAVAAYVTALLQVRQGVHFSLAALAGVGSALLLAALVAFSIRTSGVYFILLTMALGIIFWGTASRWTTLTGGESGITGVRLPEMFGLDFGDMSVYYYVSVAATITIVIGYARVTRSPFGLALRGIRESEVRMRGLGYRVAAHKFAAFVISGTMAGMAGVLYVYWNKFMSPAAAELTRAAEAVLAVALGGSGTIVGPFFGVAIITVVKEIFSADIARHGTLLGVIFVLTAIFASDGVVGIAGRFNGRLRRSLEEWRPRESRESLNRATDAQTNVESGSEG